MKKVIHHIRKQPDHIKSRYVILFALVATAIIIGIWVITLRLMNRNDDTIKTESPFKMVTGLFTNAINETKKNYQEQKTQLLPDTSIVQDDVVNSSTTTTSSETTLGTTTENTSEAVTPLTGAGQ
jgi:hypothetical protein